MSNQGGQWDPNQGGPGYQQQPQGPGNYGPGGGGYPPGGGYGPPPREPEKKSKTGLIIGGVILAIALVAAGVVLSGVLKGDDDEAASGTGGEVILAAATDPGPDPYSTTPFATAPSPAPAVTQAEAVRITAPANATTTSSTGGTPGLYGGTMNKAACDPAQMVKFLADNPDKAAAWVEAMNQDPNVKLPDGSPLTVATIPDYVATLTPVTLSSDTRVTNHGYRNGKPTTLQAVLQAGTAVLVDGYGVPRVKCFCGNPLNGPVATKTTPIYTGKPWTGFSPTAITAVQKNPTIINVFILKDPTTGTLFNRPAGTTGTKDTPNNGATTTTTTTTTTAPGQTTVTTAPSVTTTVASTAKAPFDGTWTLTQGTPTCEYNNTQPCAPGRTGTVTWTCTSATCTSDSGKVFKVSGNTMTFEGPASEPFTCNGRTVPTTAKITYTIKGTTLSGSSSITAAAVPPSCPKPFFWTVPVTGSR